MYIYGDVNVKGKNSRIHLNANPDASNPYSGFVVTDVFGEDVFDGAAVYYNLSDQKWYLACANTFSKMPCRGISVASVSKNNSGIILKWGIVYLPRYTFSTSHIYVSNSDPGKLVNIQPSSIGSFVQVIGMAKTERIAFLDFCPLFVEVG